MIITHNIETRSRPPQLTVWVPILATVIVLMSTTSFCQYAMYSDVAVHTDGTVYGWGVTDGTPPPPYEYMYHDAYVTSTLTSPNGRRSTVSLVNTNVVRADLSLPYDPSDLGTYFIESEHKIWCPWVLFFIVTDTTTGSGYLVPQVHIELECPPGKVCSGPPSSLDCIYTPVSHIASVARAVGSPPNGSFQWTLGPRLASKNGTTGAMIEVEGVGTSSGREDTWISVTYTLDNMYDSASSRATVLYAFKYWATSLGGQSQTQPLPGGGYATQINYWATDQFGAANIIQVDGAKFAELLTTLSTSEPVTFDPPSGQNRTTTYSADDGGTDVLSIVPPPAPGPTFQARREQTLYFENQAFSPQFQNYRQTYAWVEIEWLNLLF